MSRGTEWCIVRDTLITEVRGILYREPGRGTWNCLDFPYAERGYLNKT